MDSFRSLVLVWFADSRLACLCAWPVARRRLFAFVCLAIFAQVDVHAAGQTETLVGVWLVEVHGSSRMREFEVLSAGQPDAGIVDLKAKYGWLGGKHKKVIARVDFNKADAELYIATPAESVLLARMTGPASFKGTLKTKEGKTYNATLTLVANFPSVPPSELGAHLDSTLQDNEDEPRSHLESSKIIYKRDAQIDVVYFGGNDCPPCRIWRGLEYPKLQPTLETRRARFFYVTKSIRAPVPVSSLPEEVKTMGPALLDASAGRGGSSQTAFIVDGKLADYWFGWRDAQEISGMIEAVREGKPLPGKQCVRWSATRQCLKRK